VSIVREIQCIDRFQREVVSVTRYILKKGHFLRVGIELVDGEGRFTYCDLE
jgi:hypothetical protein